MLTVLTGGNSSSNLVQIVLTLQNIIAKKTLECTVRVATDSQLDL